MKKIKIISAVTAGLILCVMLLSSCAIFPQKAESPYLEGQRLNVVESEIEYSDDQMTETVIKLTNIASELIFRREGLVLTDGDKSEMRKNINSSVEEIIKFSSVGYGMVTELLTRVEERIAEDEKELTLNLFCDLYLICIGELGRERASKLVFSSTLAYLDGISELERERYEKYGYEWYLANAEKHERLSFEIKEEIGYQKFSDALGVVFFSASLAAGTPIINGEESFSLDESELLLLLKKQASYLGENTITSAQWQTVFELLFELVISESDAPQQFDDVESEFYLAIKNCEEYALQIGKIMPHVTNLYVAVVNKLSKERLSRLMSNDASIAKIELLNSVYMCKNEYFALSSNFSKLRFASEHEKNALVRKEVYDDYMIYEKYRKAVDSADLYNTIGGYLKGIYSKEQLDGAIENYLFSTAPYFTYVFVFDNRK